MYLPIYHIQILFDMALNKEKLQFLIDNSDFLIRFISYCYPLPLSTIDRFYMLLDWTELSVNQQVNWNEEYVKKYQHLLNFGSKNNKGHIGWLGYNEALPWSESFINKYYDKWEWSILANNKSIIGDPTLRNLFYEELLPFLGQLDNEDENSVEENDFVTYICNELEYINENPELQFNTVEEIAQQKEIDWLELSTNEYLPWNIELIEKYKGKWDWQLLSLNEELPWSLPFIEYFRDSWVWGEYRNSTLETSFILGLSSNSAIKWDINMIDAFKEKISWELLSANSGVRWDFELLTRFEQYWDYSELALNENFWFDVFPQLADIYVIESLLLKIERSILQQKYSVKISKKKL